MLAKTIVGSVLVALVSAVCVATPARSTEKGGSVAIDVAADEAGSMRASVVFVGLDRELSRAVLHVAPGRESKLHVRARSDEGERLAQAD